MTNERHEKALEAAEPEWIEHDGSSQPVPNWTRVEIKFRDGTSHIGKAAYWYWKHDRDQDESDILAYRIVSPNHFTSGE
jgi:hypothetical protein